MNENMAQLQAIAARFTPEMRDKFPIEIEDGGSDFYTVNVFALRRGDWVLLTQEHGFVSEDDARTWGQSYVVRRYRPAEMDNALEEYAVAQRAKVADIRARIFKTSADKAKRAGAFAAKTFVAYMGLGAAPSYAATLVLGV